MNKIENIYIHCSESEGGNVDLLRKIHRQEKGWNDIGYNAVITNGYETIYSKYNLDFDGIIQVGRALDFSAYIEENEIGAHTLGYNKNSIGVCLIGVNKFTINEMRSLYHFCNMFLFINPKIKILGHYESENSNGKTCPNIDMDKLRKFLFGYETTESRIRSILSDYIKEFQ